MYQHKSNQYFAITSLYIALAIALGAFGAHALKDQLSEYQQQVYQTANFYHFVVGIGCFLILQKDYYFVTRAFWLNLTGGLIFSSTLYLLAITGIKWLGAITPIGGSLMIIAWVYFAYKLFLHGKDSC